MAARHRYLSYWLAEELGGDRLGPVYRAEDARSGRAVVLRLLRVRDVAPPDRLESIRAAVRERLRAATAVVHDNIAAVLDFTSHDETEVLVYEDVRGPSLEEIEAGGRRLPVDEVLTHAIGLAGGLASAHARGVTHGRIGPGNIRIGADGRARLLDLGVPRDSEVAHDAVHRPDAAAEETERRRDVESLGRVIQYMLKGDVLHRAVHTGSHTGGLAGSILEAAGRVLGMDAPDADALRSALVDVAKHTPADRGFTLTRAPRTLAVPAGPAAPPASLEAEPTGPTLPEPSAAGNETPAVIMPFTGQRRRVRVEEETHADAGLLVPEPRPAPTRGQRTRIWWRNVRKAVRERIPTAPTAAQFIFSATAGALLVLLAIAVLRPESDPDGVVPAATEQSAVPAEPSPVGDLRVSVDPTDARVSLNGGPWRPAPVTFLDLPVAVYEIRITAPGFATRTDSVRVTAGEAVRREYRLGRGD